MTPASADPKPPSWTQSNYRFTTDWFEWHWRRWKELFEALAFMGRPDLHYLEVGSFEGASMLWMLENVLTHPSSTCTVVDRFGGDYRELFEQNLQRAPGKERVRVHNAVSQLLLRKLPLHSFDIVFLDGGHHSAEVMLDASLSWDLLRAGGVLIFDDYELEKRGFSYPRDGYAKPAVDLFLMAFGGHIDVLHKSDQVIVQKKRLPFIANCIQIGHCAYNWITEDVFSLETGRRVDTSSEERSLLKSVAEQAAFSYDLGEPAMKLLHDPRLAELRARVGMAPTPES